MSLLSSICSINAATVIVLGSAPTIDGSDIANLNTTTVSSDILNGDRGYMGLTFTTGANVGGYELNTLIFLQGRSVSSTGGNFINWGESGKGSDYTGGESYRSGGTYNTSPSNPIVSDSGVDRFFHLDIVAVPEPTATVFIGIGALSILCRRRKRATTCA